MSKKIRQLSKKTGLSKIGWCLKQKKGIEIVEQNDTVAKAYFSDADESLLAMEKNSGKWRVVTAYYACYNALYALLMKAGIKCEIHDCTIATMMFLDFTLDEIKFMINLKNARIDVQYYLKPAPVIDSVQVKRFVVDCRVKSRNFSEEKIKELRGKVKNG